MTIRPFQAGDLGWIVSRHGEVYWTEYGWNHEFEALVAEIVAGFVRDFVPDQEQCWIAEIDGRPVGSIMCVRIDDRTAKLRLLLVEATARGKGVGKSLVETCIAFARDAGYEEMVLWTNDVLSEARSIYERRGFVQNCDRTTCKFRAQADFRNLETGPCLPGHKTTEDRSPESSKVSPARDVDVGGALHEDHSGAIARIDWLVCP